MLTLNAPAKINWFLFVAGKRPDGYHDISSLMQCVTLFDSVTFEESDDVRVVTESPIPEKSNLIYKAAVALKEKIGYQGGATITLKKEIPLASGMGGGSSDAAITLEGLNELWSAKLDKIEMARIGASIGSDIPFFFDRPTAIIEGRGEIVTPVEIIQPYCLLLLNPLIAVSAREAYEGLKNMTKISDNIKLMVQALAKGDIPSFASMAGNDLERPVIDKYPEIGRLKEYLKDHGASYAGMSGSGSTVFGVFSGEKEAESARRSINAPWSRVVDTII